MSVDPDKLLDSVSFVLSFLRDVGFPDAEKALVEEVNQKFPALRSSVGLGINGDDTTDVKPDGEGPSSSAEALVEGLPSEATLEKHDNPASFHRMSALGSIPISSRKSTGDVVVPSSMRKEQLASLLSAPASPWGCDVDEYDNMDDVGYRRKHVMAKDMEQFVELELELTSEEGSDRLSCKVPIALTDDQQQQSEPQSEADTPQQSPPADLRRAPHAPTQMPAAVAEYMARQGGSHAERPEAAAHVMDETWDMGPTDIKLADPVITPRKARGTDEEPGRPVLSRVESLSSSFKDFDLDDDDQGVGRGSQPSDTELLSDSGAIQFNPPLTDLSVMSAQALDLFSRGRAAHSRTSSTEAPPSPCEEAGEVPLLSAATPRDSELQRELNDLHSDAKETTPGGFSFPVTPTAEDTDSKLFKSWPSVRSSLASELVPNLDDVSAMSTEYADDEYRSKLSSRTPSQRYEEARDLDPGSSGWLPSFQQLSQHQNLPLGQFREGNLADTSPCAPGSDALTSSQASPVQSSHPGDREAQPEQGMSIIRNERHSFAAAAAQAGGPRTPLPGDADARVAPWTVQGEGEGEVQARLFAPGTSGGLEAEEAESASLDAHPAAESSMDWREEEEGSQDQGDYASDTEQPMPKYTIDETGAIIYMYDPDYINLKYEVFDLHIVHRRHHTGFEETKDFPIRMNDLIAGRYQVVEFLGSAAFSRAVQALDIKTNALVCLKIVKNSKDYLDQSLDEVKLLKYVNGHDPDDEHGIVRLYDYFYYKEHLFLVCELLRANLYEFQKYNKDSGEALYFTNARIQKISISVLKSLAFLHSLDLIHSDLKPENILIKSYSRCEVKVIDLGSSCFTTDQLSSYVQSRSYRAPEVMLGLPYGVKADIWSLGCILAELSSGSVLFQNDSVATLLARMEGILGRMPAWMLENGRYCNRYYTRSGQLYERVQQQQQQQQQQSTCLDRIDLLLPKKTSLRQRVPDADDGLVNFISFLLNLDPNKRPSAREALNHPWLQHRYSSLDA